MGRKLLDAFASLRLTVALLALSMVLIFVGTLVQARIGVWETVDTYFRSAIAWIDPAMLLRSDGAESALKIPFPGGMTLGILLFLNLMAAHAARFKLTGRRVGVMVLHAGLILLLVGEFVTAKFADEGLMTVDVGSSSRFVEDVRSVELAVIDPSPEGHDRVLTIPESLVREAMRRGEPLRHDAMPFEVHVERWLPNARLLVARGATPADRGVGREAIAEELPPVRGVDGAQTDAPAALVRLTKNGRTLGTWLLWTNLIEAQRVELDDGRLLGVSLRYRRIYKPYEIHLHEFRHDVFVGTQIPKNFSSRVRIVDDETGTDRETLIWMNNPLRYRGATFYQASYKPDGSASVFQVVRNPGAALPYIACGLVGGGMALHFSLGMVSFFRKRAKRRESERQKGSPAAGTAPDPAGMSLGRRALPWIAFIFGLLLACSALYRPQPHSAFDLDTFGVLPVSAGGRIKPMDTQARHALLVAGGRQAIRTGEGRVDAREFLLGLMARPEAVRNLPVVRVDHPDVLSMLGLEPSDAGRISLSKIEPHWERIAEQADRAFELEPKQRDPFQRGVVNVYNSVQTLLLHAHMRAPHTVPPLDEHGSWRPFHEAFLDSGMARPAGHPTTPTDLSEVNPAIAYYIAMMTAYSEDDPEAFNRAARGYEQLLRREMPGTMSRADREVLFNRASLFTGTMAVYVLVFLMICGSMLLRLGSTRGNLATVGENLRVAALGMLWAAFVVHTLAILLRMELQGRPPVTNLYSSAVFVGWAAVLFGAVLERLYPIGAAAMGAAAVGFSTLVVAHHLGSDGDTMEMMQAVLDSNFWLATHVITITLGYSATFLAGALGALYIVLGVFTKRLGPDLAQTMGRMVYGIVCFALLLSFVGTVLGGIWADQSWGRFWGWDPKENGAALVVLLNAIILHARWGGIIRLRGIMALAVAGNIVTAWSWFGTNMLGVGLHAYGFMESAVFWLVAFVVVNLVLIGIGLLPEHLWRSRTTRRTVRAS